MKKRPAVSTHGRSDGDEVVDDSDSKLDEDEIASRIRNAEDARLPGRLGANVTPRRFVWLWHGRFPRGKVIEVCGDPGVFKTGVVIDFCARITKGAPFPTEPDDRHHDPA